MVPCVILMMWVVTTVAVPYGDYSSGPMPHYNNEDEGRDAAALLDDDSDRSPDAPAHLDYKFEDETHDKAPEMSVKSVVDEWPRETPLKIQKKSKPPVDYDTNFDRAPDEIQDFKQSRNSKFRNKNRYKDERRKDTERARALKYHNRGRKISEDEKYIRDDYYRNNIRPRKDSFINPGRYDLRDIKKRGGRRKPRDRALSQTRIENVDVDEEEDDVKGKARHEDEESDYRDVPHEGRRRTTEIDDPAFIQRMTKIKNFNEYNYDEYDAKRISRIQSKLPDFFRNTKASEPEEVPSTRHLQDITAFRRFNPPEESPSKSTTPPTTSTTPKRMSVTNPTPRRTVALPARNSSDLSLAEKSRLSILKKAQRKEGAWNGTLTTKPPVLMQVTQVLHTLVMVEPPQASDFPLRAREIFDDSPERLARAKKLMRHKIVAGARSIQDLTDNWDEVICDYIDTSLLDSDGAFSLCISNRVMFLSLLCIFSVQMI